MNIPKLLIALIVSALTSEVLACTCLSKETPKGAYKSAANIFTGTVLSIEQSPPYEIRITFRVLRSYKGFVAETITVRTAFLGSECAYYFEGGKSYLVYAYGHPNSLNTSNCSRTSPIHESQEEIRSLGNGRDPSKYKHKAPNNSLKPTPCAPHSVVRFAIR